jgi:hypothetical protein
MLLAALRRQGNAMEAPYAELLQIAKRELVPAELKAEIPLWRAMALIYRGQFQAALEKFEEIRADAGSWRAPKLYQLLADAYSAHCCQRLGRSSEGVPFREAARQASPKKSKIAALKLGKKSRLEAR